MNFTPDSSFSSMQRLGRTSNLLERTKLESGRDLVTEVKSFILENSETGGLLSLLGHPSAGKTTEFNKIARELSSDNSMRERVFALYTEFQNSEISDETRSSDFIWEGITTGCVDFNIHGSDVSRSLETFCSSAKILGRIPVILIDTLDILMLYSVDTNDEFDIATKWAEFLETAISNKVVLIWTCRPFEWKYFDEKIDPKFQNIIESIELPLLSKEQLNSFPKLETLDLDLSSVGDWNIEQAWEIWSIHFQQHMPIFADRWAETTNSGLRLDEKLFMDLAGEFKEYVTDDLEGKHWWEFADRLPTEHLYFWAWNNIRDRLTESYGIDKDKARLFQEIVETNAKISALNLENNSSRVRLDVDSLNDEFRKKLGVNSARISDFYKICKSRGMLNKSGIWVDFHHQLLFEEAVINSADEDELDSLEKFPSIQLRSTNSIQEFIQAKKIHVESVLSMIGHWMGYSLSFHPKCLRTHADLPQEWDTWTQYSNKHDIVINVAADEESENENAEKREILERFFRSDGSRGLIVNGAPGTGKTYFCAHYLKKILSIRKQSKSRIRWRYYTVNKHLAEHFSDSVIPVFTRSDPEFNLDLERSDGTSSPISEVFRELIPNLDLEKSWNRVRGIGLLTFSVFKEKIREFYNTNSIKNSGVRCPPIADAWMLYNHIIHDPVTGSRTEELTEKKFYEMNKNFRFLLRKSEINAFIKFHQDIHRGWYTYSYSSYLSRIRFEKLTNKEKSKLMLDVLIVDEVQDISPPVMALLLELMKPGFKSHSIVIAGDTLQTVNRSGFEWINFSDSTAKSLENSSHPNRASLSQFGVYDENELSRYRETLRKVWRNSNRLIDFNNHMRRNYASNFDLSEEYSHNFDYPDGDLKETNKSIEKDSDSEIVVFETSTSSDYDNLIKELSKASEELVGQRVALITPFELRDDEREILRESIKNVYIYDSEDVKGLEFNSVIVLMPYLVPEEEARASIDRNLDSDATKIDAQIKMWAQSWKEGKDDASSKNFENFNQLFLNIMTRMNVLFSRPEKRLLIISPVEFGKSVQIHQHSEDSPVMISFGTPEIPYKSVQITDNSKITILDTLTVSSDTSDLMEQINVTLGTASLNDDGTQSENEKRAWDNLWFNVASDSSAPRSSIAYAGGIEFDDNVDIFKALRADLGRNLPLDRGAVRDKENQIINAILSGNKSGDDYLFEPDIAYYIFSNLESVLRTVMQESVNYPRLHNFIMQRLFGIDVARITNYDFETFLSKSIRKDTLHLEDFSSNEKIDKNGKYKISVNTNEHREIILRHMLERVKYEQNDEDRMKLKIMPVEEWVAESQSLWEEVLDSLSAGNFDQNIVQNSEFSNFVNWLSSQFEEYSPVRPTGAPYGITYPTRREWSNAIASNDTIHPMRESAWIILDKVIPGLHDKRTAFSLRDKVYVAVYTALGLQDKGSEVIYDIPGLRILHDVLDLTFTNSVNESNQTVENGVNSVVLEHDHILSKSSKSLAKHMGSLNRHWLDNTPNYGKESSKTQYRGKSVTGAMIHMWYLMDFGFKDVLANKRQSSIIRTVDQQLNNFFTTGAPKLDRNKEDNTKWIKNHLQNPTFRFMLGRILIKLNSNDNHIFEAQTENVTEKFLSRLLLIEFVSLTDSSCNESTRMDVNSNNGIPTFNPKEKDGLTESIIYTYLTSKNVNPLFFKYYADDLEFFFDGKDRKIMSGGERWKHNSRFFNKKMWYAWEWMLKLLKDDQTKHDAQSEDTKPVRVTRKKTQIKNRPTVKDELSKLNSKWNSLRNNYNGEITHRMLRIDQNENLNRIYNVINRGYLKLQTSLTGGRLREAILDEIAMDQKENEKFKTGIGYDVIRFTGIRIDSRKKQNWIHPQRLIYSQIKQSKEGVPFNYIDWEICFNLWKNTPGNDYGLSFEELTDEVSISVGNEITNIVKSHTRNKDLIISFKEIADKIDSKIFELMLTFMGKIMNSGDIFSSLKLNVPPLLVNNSIFSATKEYNPLKRELVANLINYIMRKSSNYKMKQLPAPPGTGRSVQTLASFNQGYHIIIDDQEA